MMSQMIIRVDESLKSNVSMLAKTEGRTTSELVRNLLSDYVREHDASAYIEDLWRRIGKSLESKGYTAAKVPSVIKKVRSARKRK